MVSNLWKRLRTLAWTSGQIAVMLSLAFFVFEITQSWVDAGISTPLLRWVLPIGLSFSLIATLGSFFIIVNVRHTKDIVPPEEALASAIIDYARQLNLEGRDQTLVNLRNFFTATLHILGFHEIRTQLGELTLRSATIVRDNATRAEVLIDDLGWAHYLLGRELIARKNIERGVKVASTSKQSEVENLVRLSLCEAKGLRHLAIIIHNTDETEANLKLEQALGILTSLENRSLPEVRRDIAQIHHGKALMIAASLGIHKAGRIRQGDVAGIQQVDQALAEVRTSAEIFRQVADLDRYAKALFLEVRLLEARGADTEASEVSALRDRILAASSWIRPEGIKTLTGV